VELSVKPHAHFKRDGENILLDLPISITEAVEGARIQAPTPTGPVVLTVPAGANTGMVLKLKGKGVAGTGDQLVRLVVTLADSNDEELRRFVKKWAGRDKTPPRPGG